ncbi:MBOAT family O-acyltransferase [Sedimentimonas flavescens]|uniref:MBOAT family O-acyltransferase n=1 Tax=Sedimentimonas flavescens TaxID=2851012 RepID=UPI0021A962C9|nr:MBOAT family O-acyltransferase [Sedimentimonas flavescens]MCT2541093.1 hypothetical protein [Sedimentimonas flavescens]
MIGVDFLLFIAFSLACVPLVWLVPRTYAFDAVAAWTLAALLAYSPATAAWVASIAFGLPMLLTHGARRKDTLAAALSLLIAAAFVFSRLTPGWGWIGGAFFTLRALHVVIEWWMGRLRAPGLRESLRYFLFLPVFVAGPINRLPHFQHQLRRWRWDTAAFMTGAERLLLGLVFIYFIAGGLVAELHRGVVKLSEGAPAFWSSWALSAVDWINLYFVFAGATHVALGISLMMGLTLEENFDRPWAARSLISFWQRWHMSLTLWVRDYVFRPLAALTRSPLLGLVVAMLAVGLWHEFSVYYVLWSLWQSLGILAARFVPRWIGIDRLGPRAIAVLGPLSVFAWLSAARPVIGLLGVMQ